MSEPHTPDRGCALDDNGQLMDASRIEFVNSPSDESRADHAALTSSSVAAAPVAQRTRGRIGSNGLGTQSEKANSKKSNVRKSKKRAKKNEGPVETVEEDASSESDLDPGQTIEMIDTLAALDEQVVIRSKTAQSADIRTIFMPHSKTIDGKITKGFVCTICMQNPLENQTFFRGNNSTLRTHISRFESHYTKYIDLCQERGIQTHSRALPAASIGNGETQQTMESFVKCTPVYTPQRFLELLVRLVVSDDQAFLLVDKVDFRQLLLYLRPSTRDGDIPHRTKMKDLVMAKAREVVQDLFKRFKEVKGLISFTFDTWTSRAGDPYLAVTAHFVSHPPGQPTMWFLENVVIGFCHIIGNHGGENIACIITRVIDRFGLRSKIGWFTLDNASVNDTTMECLTNRGMAAQDIIGFDIVDRRVRCAAHVLNLAARAFIEGIAPTPPALIRKKLAGIKRKRQCIYDDESGSEDEGLILPELTAAFEGLNTSEDEGDDDDDNISDLLGKVLLLITQIKLSPQARAFFEESCQKKAVPKLALKKWIHTRWSSMFDLLTRLLELQPAVEYFLSNADRTPKVPKLSDGRRYAMYTIHENEWEKLKLIHEILRDPARAQNAFSSETIPTIWRNIPILEMIQTRWEACLAQPKYESVHQGLKCGLKVLNKYYTLTDETSVNLICHFLNLMFKLGYIKKKWSTAWIKSAQKTIETVFKAYERSSDDNRTPPDQSRADAPVPIQSTGGYASAWILHAIREGNSGAPTEKRSELDNYLNAPYEEVENILEWWGRHGHEYPTLTRMARDYLAIQGSSVASERCFSSGGITGTDRRNRLDPITFEALQILKHAYSKGLVPEPSDPVEELVDYDIDPFTQDM